MALSPPPRFRQSFQSARRPLQMPVRADLFGGKIQGALEVLVDGGLALVGRRGPPGRRSATSPVSFTYSQTDGDQPEGIVGAGVLEAVDDALAVGR